MRITRSVYTRPTKKLRDSGTTAAWSLHRNTETSCYYDRELQTHKKHTVGATVTLLTLEKFAFRIFSSSKVAYLEKMPRFFSSQLLLSEVLETQPGSKPGSETIS